MSIAVLEMSTLQKDQRPAVEFGGKLTVAVVAVAAVAAVVGIEMELEWQSGMSTVIHQMSKRGSSLVWAVLEVLVMRLEQTLWHCSLGSLMTRVQGQEDLNRVSIMHGSNSTRLTCICTKSKRYSTTITTTTKRIVAH